MDCLHGVMMQCDHRPISCCQGPPISEEMLAACHQCKQPLVVIDNRRRHLVGCLICNLWTDKDGNAVRLSEEDVVALHAMRRA